MAQQRGRQHLDVAPAAPPAPVRLLRAKVQHAGAAQIGLVAGACSRRGGGARQDGWVGGWGGGGVTGQGARYCSPLHLQHPLQHLYASCGARPWPWWAPPGATAPTPSPDPPPTCCALQAAPQQLDEVRLEHGAALRVRPLLHRQHGRVGAQPPPRRCLCCRRRHAWVLGAVARPVPLLAAAVAAARPLCVAGIQWPSGQGRPRGGG